jgi:hypothetical protein
MCMHHITSQERELTKDSYSKPLFGGCNRAYGSHRQYTEYSGLNNWGLDRISKSEAIQIRMSVLSFELESLFN